MSSTKEFNMNVKYTAYALIAFILIIIAELGSFLVVSFYKDNYAINIDSELLVAIEKMNHVRHYELGRNYESLTSLIYSRNLLSLPEKEEKTSRHTSIHMSRQTPKWRGSVRVPPPPPWGG